MGKGEEREAHRTETQRSGFGSERRHDGARELSRLRGSEGCEVHADEVKWKERKGNALASGAEEGRDKLR